MLMSLLFRFLSRKPSQRRVASQVRLHIEGLEQRALLSLSHPLMLAAGQAPQAVATADFNHVAKLDSTVAASDLKVAALGSESLVAAGVMGAMSSKVTHAVAAGVMRSVSSHVPLVSPSDLTLVSKADLGSQSPVAAAVMGAMSAKVTHAAAAGVMRSVSSHVPLFSPSDLTLIFKADLGSQSPVAADVMGAMSSKFMQPAAAGVMQGLSSIMSLGSPSDFTRSVASNAALGSQSLVASDVIGDGRVDLFANYSSQAISVLLNSTMKN